MMIIKAGGHLIDHRSCIQSNRSGISGFFPDPGPASQVCAHLRVHPWGFLKLCFSEETHPLELRFERTDLVVSEEVFHWGRPQPLSWENSDLSPPFPTSRSSGKSRRIQPTFSHEPSSHYLQELPQLAQIGIWVCLCLSKIIFRVLNSGAALCSSSPFLSHHITLLTLLVPSGRCHTFEVFAVNARLQVLTSNTPGAGGAGVTPTFPCTSVLVTASWDLSSQSPGSRSPGPLSLVFAEAKSIYLVCV